MASRTLNQASSRTLILAGCLALAATSQAQWSATLLLPPSGDAYSVGSALTSTTCYGFGDQFVAGTEYSHATAWNYSGSSVADLSPSGAINSKIFSAQGTQEVGAVQFANSNVAGLWTGTASSFVNLGTGGFTAAEADNTDGKTQVGTGWTNGRPVALMWKGTAASVVDLDPDGATGFSQSFANDGNVQGGYCLDSGVWTGVIWHGSAASMASVAPAGSTSSEVDSVHGNEACGWAAFGASNYGHAGLWTNDTAGSWVDLAPAGVQSSGISDFSGKYQVGGVSLASGRQHAGFWMGGASSFVDLNQFLPSAYQGYSSATTLRVDSSGGVWIVGSAANDASNGAGVAAGVLWHYNPVPEPLGGVALALGGALLLSRRRRG